MIYLVLSIILLAIAKLLNDWISPYDLNDQLTAADNKAIGLAFTGYFISIVIIIHSVLSAGTTKGLWADIIDTSFWSLIGIALLQVSRFVNNKRLLHKFDVLK